MRKSQATSVYLHALKISEVKFTYPGQQLHIPSVPLLFLGGTENGNGKITLDKTRAVRLRKRTKYTFRGTTTVLSAFSEIAQIWLKGSHQQGSTELSLNNTLWFSLPLVQFFSFFFLFVHSCTNITPLIYTHTTSARGEACIIIVTIAQRSPRCETLVASSVTRCIRYMYKQAAAIAAYIILPNSLPLKREKKI